MSRHGRFVLFAFLAALSAFAKSPVPGALASWEFEPGHGDTLWDGSGNGHHGIIHGAGWTDGMEGKALEFRGQDWVAIPAHPRLNVNSFTFSVWLWQSGNGVRVPMVEWQVPNALVGVHLTANTSGFAQDLPGAFYANLRPHDASASQPGSVRERNLVHTAGGTAQGCRWNHVALSYDSASATVRIHVNGRLRATERLEPFIPRTTGDILLGRRSQSSQEWDAGQGLLGSLDRADLYGRALSEAEIATLYGRPPVDPLSIHLGMSTHYAEAGDTVTVPLWISSDGKDSLASLDMSLAYDTTVALLVDAALDTATVPGWAFAAAVPAGKSPVDLDAAGPKRFSGARDAVYLRLRFRLRPEARTGASTALTLSGIAADGGRPAGVTQAPGFLFVISPDILHGDVNGDGRVDLLDAAGILAYSVGRQPPSGTFPNLTLPVADVSGNGIITGYDAALVLQFALGILEVFPVQTRSLAKRAAFGSLSLSAPEALGGNLYRYRLAGSGLAGLLGGEIRLTAGPSLRSVAKVAGLWAGVRVDHRFDAASGRLDLAFHGNRKAASGEVELLVIEVEQADSDGALTLAGASLDEGRLVIPGLQDPTHTMRRAAPGEGRIPVQPGRGGLRIFRATGEPAATPGFDAQGRRLPLP